MIYCKFQLASAVVVCALIPGLGRAQQLGPIQPPVFFLPGGLIVKSSFTYVDPPTRLPEPDETTVALQPPIPPDPQLDAKAATTPRIREPYERFEAMPPFPDVMLGNGHWCWSHWQYGPRVAPPFEYPGLGGGFKVSYPWGEPGYTGCRNGPESLNRCCRLWGPPVPVYTPIPQHADAKALIYPGRNISSPGFVYGWIGPFPASPRFRHYAVSTWAQPGVDLSTGSPSPDSAPKKPNPNLTEADTKNTNTVAYMTLSVKVPDPAAEVFVNGVPTNQLGLERTFSSPDLEPGKEFQYVVTVRWYDQGTMNLIEKKVVGSSGDVIPLDFTARGSLALTSKTSPGQGGK